MSSRDRSGRADVETAATTLTRRMPDAKAELFAPLAAKVRAVFADARTDLAVQAARQAMADALVDARLAGPLATLRARTESFCNSRGQDSIHLDSERDKMG